jgi:hypothetical protein
MELDWRPRKRWRRTLAVALAVGGSLVLLDLGFLAVLKLMARVLR